MYQFNDALLTNGNTYYYKLKQIDVDFNFTWTTTKIITLVKQKSPISIFPNPTKDLLWISTEAGTSIVKVQIINQTGQQILTQKIAKASSISLANLPTGIYTVILTDNKNKYYKKVIKQ